MICQDLIGQDRPDRVREPEAGLGIAQQPQARKGMDCLAAMESAGEGFPGEAAADLLLAVDVAAGVEELILPRLLRFRCRQSKNLHN